MFRRRLVTAFVCLVGSSVFVDSATAENWPSWRGPTQNGISTERGLPTQWSRTENVAWRVPLPGPSGATPAVWDDRVFVTSVAGDQLLLICLSTDGKVLWRQEVGQGNKDVRGDEGNSASPSPVTDGKHVWSFMANGDLGCYTLDGRLAWKLNLQDRYGKFRIAFGLSSTPVLYEGRLYFQLIHGDGKADSEEALVVAMDALTGQGVWQQSRITGAHSENEHSYASPVLYDFGGTQYLISHGADFTMGHRLSDGKELWRLGGLNPHDSSKRDYHPTLRFVASAAAAEGIIVCPTAKNGPVFAIRADGSGDLTDKAAARLWVRPENTPDVPSPLIHDGLVYLCRETGNLICLDAQTGDEFYHERTHVQRHRSSPVYADGKIYLCARDGHFTVVKAGRDFEVLAENDLEEPIAASPAISNGTIYLRTYKALWAIRQSK